MMMKKFFCLIMFLMHTASAVLRPLFEAVEMCLVSVAYAHRFGGIETKNAAIFLTFSILFLMHTASAVLRQPRSELLLEL